ncbi:6410_t:CDS:2 [Cetraspora pellucida]|uniref:6410_t:CDS:1 n=1 Tax=Cetraspora pellucida TaxID=1433469 RepID=A0A9N9A353_9GLOM|nr:6410_t:CDS:2 [Cetraspora pellucida]
MNPIVKNIDLANKYSVEKSTISDILKEKECWLAITTKKEGEIRKFHMPKWLKLEKALGLWVDNALNSGQDINRHILKKKAKFFIEHLLIDNFHQSNSWLTGFKKYYGLHSLKKKNKAYNDVLNEVVKEIVSYNIYDAIINSAEAYILLQVNPKEYIELNQNSNMDDESNLLELIDYLLTNDSFNLLTAYEYIFAENDKVENRLI